MHGPTYQRRILVGLFSGRGGFFGHEVHEEVLADSVGSGRGGLGAGDLVEVLGHVDPIGLGV